MKLQDLELLTLPLAAAFGALMGQQSTRVIRAHQRKKRDRRNAIAKASRKRNRHA